MPTATRHTHADVVAAARRLFSRKGYHDASMQDLAEALGVQRGSLYAHIGGKQELLLEIVQAGAADFLAAIEPIAASSEAAATRLTQAFAAHVRVVAQQQDAATVFFHEWRFLGEPGRSRILQERERYEACWRRIVADGVQSGEFRRVDIKLAVVWLLSAANWLYQWYRPEGGLPPDELAATFADFALQGLARPDP